MLAFFDFLARAVFAGRRLLVVFLARCASRSTIFTAALSMISRSIVPVARPWN